MNEVMYEKVETGLLMFWLWRSVMLMMRSLWDLAIGRHTLAFVNWMVHG
jgi:hypothetical protein